MKPIKIPLSYNYIGTFITFACNINCSYCINHFEQRVKNRRGISGKDWVKFLNRIESRSDLPITLQGGEPSLHPDFIYIINHIKPELNIDILTNLQFDIAEFIKKVDPQRVKRKAPYASIRVSYHPETMDLEDTIQRVLKMLDKGFPVGIWSVYHPKYQSHIEGAKERCKGLGIDFRLKEFLGEHKDYLHGTYKYPDACAKKFKKNVLCKTTEFLLDPSAKVFRCHHDLYKDINTMGSLCDPEFQIQDIYRDCNSFGFCNPCDVKLKTNRFQEFGHASVEIKYYG